MLISDKANILTEGCAVALGTFDGVHRGHCAVISRAVQSGLPTVIVTSEQNPQAALKHLNSHRLMSKSLNIAEFERLGVYGAIFLDFDDIKNMSPQDYLNFLHESLNVRFISCGYNFRFGKSASGDTSTILQYADGHDIKAVICDEVNINGSAVSSTRIRALIAKGDLKSAAQLLGRNYAIDFPVEHGDERGRTIGFPTINQIYDQQYVLPKFGVYTSLTHVNGQVYRSVTNIGIRPTFRSDHVLAETHIIGFNGNLYGEKIVVELVEFLRDEEKFDSLDDLKSAITGDIKNSEQQ